MRIAVTGGSGRFGGYVIRELVANGHEVVNADRAPADDLPARFIRTDTMDFGEVVAALIDCEAVVHLAAIPNPIEAPEHRVFALNLASDWNVLQAAEIHGIGKIVKASSVNAIGAVFSKSLVPPRYFPIDEDHPTRAEDAYSLSKWLGEELARGFCRRRDVQIASMRLHGLWDEATQRAYAAAPETDPTGRSAMHFWGWVDRRDAARSCLLALETDWIGHQTFFINAADTTLALPTVEAINRAYPDVPLRTALPGFAAPIDISRARDVLGWEPRYSWRAYA